MPAFDTLLETCPALAQHPRTALGDGPTAIQRAERLGGELDLDLLIKRDDTFDLMLGGNKVRQLEFYFGEAEAMQADTILITGAVQSNFVRLAAAAARKLGMQPIVQLEERVPSNDASYRQSGNALLDHLMGATVHHYPEGEDEAGADARLEELAEVERANGRRPYVIHLGIDHPPIGALGYVVCGLEAMAQLEEAPDQAVVPSGSGLTHAGFLVGVRLAGWQGPVHGICVRRDAEAQRARVLRRAREVAALLEVPDLIAEDDVLVHDHVLKPGYGRLNREVLEAILRAARSESLLLDPVYSGRNMAGLIDLRARGTLSENERILTVHTGGTPGVFGYADKLNAALADPASVPSVREL